MPQTWHHAVVRETDCVLIDKDSGKSSGILMITENFMAGMSSTSSDIDRRPLPVMALCVWYRSLTRMGEDRRASFALAE